MEYDVSYSETSATTNLISHVSGTTTVEFKASNLIGDVKSYTITVSAKFTGQQTWVTSATATYTYHCIVTAVKVEEYNHGHGNYPLRP